MFVHVALLQGLPTRLPIFSAFFDGTAGDATKALQAFAVLADILAKQVSVRGDHGKHVTCDVVVRNAIVARSL